MIRALAAGVLLAGLVAGCAEEPLPQRRLSATDCLREVKLDRLAQALKRCDAVVAAFPRDPLPLNERYLLHTLANDEAAACRDMARATALAGTLHLLSQRLLQLEQRLDLLEKRQLVEPEEDPALVSSLVNAERLLEDCRALLAGALEEQEPEAVAASDPEGWEHRAVA